MNRQELEQMYLDLGRNLPNIHKQLNFKDHCYWRMANDNACNNKWNKKVESPFYKNASDLTLKRSVETLNKMGELQTVFELNEKSLNYRR